MDSSIMSSLRLVSYNFRGLRDSSKVYLKRLLYDCDYFVFARALAICGPIRFVG